MQSIERLVSNLSRLPGIGTKTAQRLAYHILSMPESFANELSAAVYDARRLVRFCKVCGNYTESEVCDICSDAKRSQTLLCVVKDARDVVHMERIQEFRGRYHVLGGTLSPMDGVGPDKLRITELINRIESDGVTEIILATNPDVEGEATASYIAKLLKSSDVRVTRLAHGIPIGGNLEYVDAITLTKAIENRREM